MLGYSIKKFSGVSILLSVIMIIQIMSPYRIRLDYNIIGIDRVIIEVSILITLGLLSQALAKKSLSRDEIVKNIISLMLVYLIFTLAQFIIFSIKSPQYWMLVMIPFFPLRNMGIESKHPK